MPAPRHSSAPADRCQAICWNSPKHKASQRRFLRRRTFWQALLAAANVGPLAYAGYSYALKGDLYRLELSDSQREALLAAAQSLAPRNLRAELQHLEKAAQVVFLCPRNS